jgi:hypothetical protein
MHTYTVKIDNKKIYVYENKRASEKYIMVSFYESKTYYYIPIAGHRYSFEFEIPRENVENNNIEILFNKIQSSDEYTLHNYLTDISVYFTSEKIAEFYDTIRFMEIKGEKEKFLKELISKREICRYCSNIYANNPNPQAVIRDLKDEGYYICSYTKYCENAKQKKTYDMLLPIKKSAIDKRTETIPDTIKKAVKRLYGGIDVFTGRTDNSALPDHKFPEIRWGAEPILSDNRNLSDNEIINKFQPLSNKFNLMKKEACKKCRATNMRQYPYGIKYFYYGNEKWDESIPKSGIDARNGCVGCGWYDLLQWKKSLNERISEDN